MSRCEILKSTNTNFLNLINQNTAQIKSNQTALRNFLDDGLNSVKGQNSHQLLNHEPLTKRKYTELLKTDDFTQLDHQKLSQILSFQDNRIKLLEEKLAKSRTSRYTGQEEELLKQIQKLDKLSSKLDKR